jgi:hypothetical protein
MFSPATAPVSRPIAAEGMSATEYLQKSRDDLRGFATRCSRGTVGLGSADEERASTIGDSTTRDLQSFRETISWFPRSKKIETDSTDDNQIHSPIGRFGYPAIALGQTFLRELERPERFVITFEPHLRRYTFKQILSLFERLQVDIGQPQAATTLSELRATLTTAYKRSALNPETRNLATAISLLQDFLRPHWSRIAAESLNEIRKDLLWLTSQSELNAQVLQKFYRDLTVVMGQPLSFEINDEDELDETTE